MADITMCTQTLCPNAAHCYRVQAKASDCWQSMAAFDYTISVHGVECDNYIPIYRTMATDSTGHNATGIRPQNDAGIVGHNAAGQGRREAPYPEPDGSAFDSEEPDDREERCDSCGETSRCLMNGLCPMCYELNGGTHD